jgi:hypothetical protein
MNIQATLIAFIVGLFLGIAQALSRILATSKWNSENISILTSIVLVYFLSAILWLRVLISTITLTSAYATVLLGTFISLLVFNLQNTNINKVPSIEDILGIILIFAGSLLIRR